VTTASAEDEEEVVDAMDSCSASLRAKPRALANESNESVRFETRRMRVRASCAGRRPSAPWHESSKKAASATARSQCI